MKTLLLFTFLGALNAQAFTPESQAIMIDETPAVIKAVEAEENPAKVFSGIVNATRELMKPMPETMQTTEVATVKTEL